MLLLIHRSQEYLKTPGMGIQQARIWPIDTSVFGFPMPDSEIDRVTSSISERLSRSAWQLAI